MGITRFKKIFKISESNLNLLPAIQLPDLFFQKAYGISPSSSNCGKVEESCMRYGEGEPLDSKLLPPNSQVIPLFFVILVILFQTPPPLFFYHQNPTFAVHLSTPLVFVFWIESNTFCLDSLTSCVKINWREP